MKVALFGASGMVGGAILQELLARGHQVTAIVRHPAKITVQHANLTVQAGDAGDSAAVTKLVAGHEAVISSVVDRANIESSVATAQAFIAGVKAAGVKRVLSVGGAGSLEVAPGVALVDTPQFPAEYRPESLAYREVLNLYRSLPAGELAWTVATPSIVIFPGPAKGTFRTATDNLLFDAEGNSTISNADFATALVNELENPQHIGGRFTVGY
ncbi:MAG: NAD(P)H-binding protein [Chloroflexi bacterium]|nr:NAD(P)H-binding protein [Chloroflexota bacterium]